MLLGKNFQLYKNSIFSHKLTWKNFKILLKPFVNAFHATYQFIEIIRRYWYENIPYGIKVVVGSWLWINIFVKKNIDKNSHSSATTWGHFATRTLLHAWKKCRVRTFQSSPRSNERNSVAKAKQTISRLIGFLRSLLKVLYMITKLLILLTFWKFALNVPCLKTERGCCSRNLSTEFCVGAKRFFS